MRRSGELPGAYEGSIAYDLHVCLPPPIVIAG